MYCPAIDHDRINYCSQFAIVVLLHNHECIINNYSEVKFDINSMIN